MAPKTGVFPTALLLLALFSHPLKLYLRIFDNLIFWFYCVSGRALLRDHGVPVLWEREEEEGSGGGGRIVVPKL
jgi:hypothetical protein